MKKKITRIWGVGLIIVLLSSLCIIPASTASAADPLAWNAEDIPSATGYVLNNGTDITDIAIGEDGDVIYAVGGAGFVYKSTDMGVSWTRIDTDAGTEVTDQINADLVAVANDDSDMVAIVDIVDASAFDGYVYVSTDGGTSWGSLGDLTALMGATAINDIAVSPAASGIHYVAVAAVDAPAAEVYYIKLGIGGSWKEGKAEATGEEPNTATALACAFSPNFASDLVLSAVTVNATATFFEILQLTTTPNWNEDAGFDQYAVCLQDSNGADFVAQGASIALAPTYLGGDEIERVAFVGIDAVGAGADGDGVIRMEDYVTKQVLSQRDIHSVAFDGSTCVAGITGVGGSGTTVWRSVDPLTSIPTFRGSASLKSPGGDDSVVIGFAGTIVVAGTSGNESAFSVSEDNGASFNDISLIDTQISAIEDIAVSPDGSVVYMATDDTADLSVFRKASAWERVLSVQAIANPYITRIAPDDAKIVYVAEYGGTAVYYSKEGGDTKWYKRNAPDVIQDIGVEDTEVAYMALAGGTTVTRTDNGGFVWDTPIDTELAAGNVYTIKCLGKDQVIVSSDAGCVSYSTDGGEEWTKIDQSIGIPIPIQVTADGLEEGSHIYAGTSFAFVPLPMVFMWNIGQEQTEPWDLIGGFGAFPALPTNSYISGLTMQGGTLYASTSNGTASTMMRNTMPWFPEVGFVFWSATYDPDMPMHVADDFDNVPSEMRMSATAEYNKVWACGDTTLYSFMDTLAVTAPTAIAPADGATVPLNAESGVPYNVTFTWTRPSLATSYTIFIALDPFYVETVVRLPDCITSWFDTVSYTLTDTSLTAAMADAGGYGSLATLTPGTTYYWGVQASSPLTSGFSAMPGWAFTVEAGVAVSPSIGSPPNGSADVGTNPAFSWSPVSRATEYEFQLSADTTFAEPLYSETLTTTGIQPPVTLEPGVTYFWRVRAVSPVTGDWSTIANFTVALPAEPPPEPVEIIQQPAPEIVIEQAPPLPDIVLESPPPPEEIAPGYIWAIIVIGAILVIAVIVLIVRTRRQV